MYHYILIKLSMCNAGYVQYSTELVIWIKYGILSFQPTQAAWLALQGHFPELDVPFWVGVKMRRLAFTLFYEGSPSQHWTINNELLKNEISVK